jgi:hypothetical protein
MLKTTQAQRDAARRWREKNPGYKEAQAKRQRERRLEDPAFLEKQRQSNRKWYLKNKENAGTGVPSQFFISSTSKQPAP